MNSTMFESSTSGNVPTNRMQVRSHQCLMKQWLLYAKHRHKMHWKHLKENTKSNSILFAFSPKSHPGCPLRFFLNSTLDINNFKAPHIDNFVCWSSAIPRSNRRRIPNSSTDLTSTYPSREYCDIYIYMGVSENSGTRKSSILIGFSIKNHPFWGTSIFGNPHK